MKEISQDESGLEKMCHSDAEITGVGFRILLLSAGQRTSDMGAV